jgi:hypothetical protein
MQKKGGRVSKRGFLILLVVMFAVGGALLAYGISSFFPPNPPQTFEVVGKVEIIEQYYDIRKNKKIITLENGEAYIIVGGAYRTLDKEKFDLMRKGDTVWILAEKGTSEIRALSVNGEVNFSIEDYLKEDYEYEIIPGVIFSTVAVVSFIFAFYMIVKMKSGVHYDVDYYKAGYKTARRLKLPNMHKGELKAKYENAFSIVKRALDEWDPLGFLEVDLDYEHESEAAHIAPSVVRGAGTEELTERINKVFRTTVDDAFKSEGSEAVAEKILSEYNNLYHKS